MFAIHWNRAVDQVKPVRQVHLLVVSCFLLVLESWEQFTQQVRADRFQKKLGLQGQIFTPVADPFVFAYTEQLRSQVSVAGTQ